MDLAVMEENGFPPVGEYGLVLLILLNQKNSYPKFFLLQ